MCLVTSFRRLEIVHLTIKIYEEERKFHFSCHIWHFMCYVGLTCPQDHCLFGWTSFVVSLSFLFSDTLYSGNINAWRSYYANILLLAWYRPWDYPENFWICSQLDRKSKTWFFTFLNVYIFWIEQDKILISQLSPPKFRYFTDQNEPKGDPMKISFDNFQIEKWIS